MTHEGEGESSGVPFWKVIVSNKCVPCPVLKYRGLRSCPACHLTVRLPGLFPETAEPSSPRDSLYDSSEQTGLVGPGIFCRGFTTYSDVQMHPDGRRVIVVSCGDGYLIDPDDETRFENLSGSLEELIWSPDRKSLILNDQGFRLVVLSSDGRLRFTRRFSWDGLADISTDGTVVRGLAFEPFEETWRPFSVALDTLEVEGGTYSDGGACAKPTLGHRRRWWQFWKR